jgi:acetyl esterase/lipase
MTRRLLLFLAAALAALPQQRPASWVEPTRTEPPGSRFRTFFSKTIQAEVSYLVYLPPEYETSPKTRYPVIYWLHGLGGDQRSGVPFAERLQDAIRRRLAPAMIAVLVNGMVSSMYTDSADGKTPVESVIVRDLLPHIDSTYRTIADREARAIEGFSMGGFGAARIGFKYPDTFGLVSILAGALHTADTLAERRKEIFHNTYGADKDYYTAESPWTILERNADRIRGRTRVRVWVGEKDGLLAWNTRYHELLDKLKIAHDFRVVPGAAHNYRQVQDAVGPRGFAFYNRTIPGAEVEVVRDVEYCAPGGRALRMHLVRPSRPAREPMPVVVWIHGGAWRAGSRDSGIPQLLPFARRGYFGASIEYRFSSEAIFPAQIEDAKCAVRFLRSKAKQYGIDPNRIGVWGSSAGGHLVALLGTSGEGDARVQAVCDFFGPTDFLQMDQAGGKMRHDAPESPESQLVGGPIQENKEKVARANPLTFVSKDDPPFLILHGDQDPLVPLEQSRLLYEALLRAGVDVTFHVVKGAGHGFGGPEIDEMVDSFFDRHLRKP